jgi:membrane protease YdiL (CAAX protease family)
MNKRKHDPYNFPEYLQRNPVRRIWRVIYPALLFILIQMAVTVIFSMIAYAVFTVQGMLSIGLPNLTDYRDIILTATEKATKFLAKHSMHIVLITDIAVLAVFIPMWLKTRRYRPTAVKNAAPARPIALTALLVPGISLVLSIIIGLLGMNEISENFQQVMEMITGTSFVLQVVAVAIIGPIAEELIFRGVILNRALSWMPRWSAVVLSSALFGVIHMNIPQGVFAFCIGMICGWSYVRFRSLWVPIAAHISINLTSTVINRMSQSADPNDPMTVFPVTILMIAVFALSAVLIYPWLKTKNASIVYPDPDPVSVPAMPSPAFAETHESQEFVWRIAEDDE